MTQDQPVATLETPRLTLRAFALKDALQIFHIFSDPAVMAFWNAPPMEREEEVQAYIEETLALCRLGGQMTWAVVHSATHAVIGMCGLAEIHVSQRRAEIGYALRRNHWGQGLISEALPAVLYHAYSDLALNRIEAYIDPPNLRSIRVVERLGFVREGLLRQRRWAGGRVHDSWLYAMLHEEWVRGTGAPAMEPSV